MLMRILTTTMLTLLATPVFADTWVISPGGGEIVFVSKAPMETIVGKSDQVSGTITLDPARVVDSVSVHIEINMASLDTGKEKRNRHMRENHLETEKYPTAVFDGATVVQPRGVTLETEKEIAFDVVGTLDLHGVKRRLSAKVKVKRTSDGSLEFEAKFPIILSDYEISRPKFLFLKLNETQDVTVKATARRQ